MVGSFSRAARLARSWESTTPRLLCTSSRLSQPDFWRSLKNTLKKAATEYRFNVEAIDLHYVEG